MNFVRIENQIENFIKLYTI